jgi:UDP-3-O-[3-hydroxymyristoyl] N-acetylglucosamine deacetylase
MRKKYIKIKQMIDVVEEDKWVRLEPYNGYMVKLSIRYDHPLFTDENSDFVIDFAKDSYVSQISRARTFAFMYEIENIRKNGLGLGGNLNNAVVIDDDTVLNEGGLRFKDEFVRHKILDAIGDLYIGGHQIIGAFEGFKSGHAINNKLLRKLLNTPEAWEYIVFDNDEQVPPSFHYVA